MRLTERVTHFFGFDATRAGPGLDAMTPHPVDDLVVLTPPSQLLPAVVPDSVSPVAICRARVLAERAVRYAEEVRLRHHRLRHMSPRAGGDPVPI